MSQASLDARAQELRAQGLKYREIGEAMGETQRKAWMRCNRERENANTARSRERRRTQRRAYDRWYLETHRARCPRCGHVYGIGTGTKSGRPRKGKGLTFEACPGCSHERAQVIVHLWAEGLTLVQIAKCMGWSRDRIGVEFDRLRSAGYDLPYRYRGKKNCQKFPHLQKAAA